MIEIEKPRIECIETPTDSSYGKYIVEPLERGYGTTLGNSLRRVLLSSLPGTAVTSIKIAGIQHGDGVHTALPSFYSSMVRLSTPFFSNSDIYSSMRLLSSSILS